MIKRIEVPDRNNEGQTFMKEVYQIDENDELVGIILGHFAPFTGPKGHGRMIEALKNIGCKKFMIAIPETKKGRDDDRNMFTLPERIEIAEMYLESQGLDGIVVTYSGWNPKINNTKLFRRAIKEFGENSRPVFCYGPDRQNFVEDQILFDTVPEGRRSEYIVCNDRGETECSGTEVRNRIREGDLFGVCELTGYSEDMAKKIMKIYEKGKLNESRLYEGGNMSIADDEGNEVMATKLLTGKMSREQFDDFRSSFFLFLKELNRKYESIYGEKIWNNEDLITQGKIYSGSTRAFFQKDFADFTKFKKSVGDFDIQLPERCKENFSVWVEELTGKTIGDFTFYGSRTKGEQSHSLVTVNQDKFPNIGAEYVQFDWEYTPWDDEADKPSEWNDVSHYSSWEDIENGVKGAFVKILLKAAVQTVSSKSSAPFYSLKTGKPVKTPEDAKEYTFNVDKGVTKLLTNVGDGYGKLETKDRTSIREMDFLFQTIFGRPHSTPEEKRALVSFVRLIKLMNTQLEESLIQRIFTRFLDLLYGVHEQQISRDLAEDKEVKRAAADKFVELCPAVSDWKDVVDQKEEEYFTSEFRKEGNRYGQADARARKLAALEAEKMAVNESRKMNEEVSEDGTKLYVYSSSKDSDLFKFYFGKELKFGLNGGSAYGLATYAILSDPFSGLAEVGYSDAARSNLYGDNCFEFEIPVEKVFFFEFDDYAKTVIGKESTPSTFIREQAKRFGLNLSEEQINELSPVEGEEFSARMAQAFYRFMSRIYYQDSEGALVTPCAGFVYKGKNDGRTYVGWDAYQLNPNRFTNDLGQTWQDCDKDSPEYQEYLSSQGAERKVFDPFDGNKTPRKEAIYRLFQKFNSSDDTSDKLADGVFSNIVIHDDKTVDCKFRSNLPYVDRNKHYFRITNGNHLILSLNKLGYKFGKLDCGIKFGNEAIELFKEDLIENIKPEMWPESCTGGMKIAGTILSRETLSHIPTRLGSNEIYIVGCQIDDDCLNDYVVDGNEKKPCWSSIPEICEKYDFVLTEKPTPKAKRQLKNPDAIARAEAAAKAKAEKEAALRASVDKSWNDDVDNAMKMTESMSGKHSLKHLYNNNGSTQLKPLEFLDFVDYLTDEGMKITPQNCEITEKIDGSSQFFGYDQEGFFWEKFRMKDKVRLPDELIIDGRPTKYYSFVKEIYDSEKFEDFCIDLMAQTGASEVKVQLEVVLTAAGGFDDELCQIVVVPYSKSMMPKDGMCFVIQVLADGNQLNDKIKEVASILNREDLAIQPPETYEFEEIDLSMIIEDLYDELGDVTNVREILASRKAADKPLKEQYTALIQDTQKEMQSIISSNFQTGKHGQYYEGLVLNFGEWLIKITSDKFKEFMAIHNRH